MVKNGKSSTLIQTTSQHGTVAKSNQADGKLFYFRTPLFLLQIMKDRRPKIRKRIRNNTFKST